MKDILDVIRNIDTIYNNNSSLAVLKDFERVLDEMDIYVYKNWLDGEILSGPKISRHWVYAEFMWPKNKMPDPDGARRLKEIGCKIKYTRDEIIEPRKIRTPDDFRPGTKKGKLDTKEIWVVKILMPKKLVFDIFNSYMDRIREERKGDKKDIQQQQPMMAPPAQQGMAPGMAPAAPMAAPVAGAPM
ncbi:hypothetical protein EB118_10050 [bacterium]|nr:hypothetical protein [bacterium]